MPTPAPSLSFSLPGSAQRRAKWTADFWVFVRPDGDKRAFPGSELGGSQAGARLRYRLAQRIEASLRAYMPLAHPDGGELALGVEWQPSDGLPIHVVAERRQAIGAQGRSAFAALAYGGISKRAGPVNVDIYAQAGAVGLKAKDLFADGTGAVRWRAEERHALRLGIAAWGAVQPGAARLDVGPTASFRPVPRLPVTVSVDWRHRIAGEAAPRSGPAITISTGF